MSEQKMSLKDKLKKRREEIKKRTEGGPVIFPKEGTLRFRVLPVPKDTDWSIEADYFYLGQEIKGVFSPKTIGEPCPIFEKYKSLKDSKSSSDKDLAKELVPKKKYLIPVLTYKDEEGKEIDTQNSIKLMLIPGGIYTEMIDYYVDSEYDEFNDPENGFDFKLVRTGKGKTDTKYTLRPVKPKPINPKYAEPVDLDVMLKEIILSYDETEEKLLEYLASRDEHDDHEEDDQPPKKKLIRKKPE
jgi:hypothetical protein